MFRSPFGLSPDEIEARQAADALASSTHTVLDVRERDEWDDGHITGTMHIPMSELMTRLNEVPTDKPVIAMCHSGSRSLHVVQFLKQRGYQEPKSLAGGIVAMARAGQAIVR